MHFSSSSRVICRRIVQFTLRGLDRFLTLHGQTQIFEAPEARLPLHGPAVQ